MNCKQESDKLVSRTYQHSIKLALIVASCVPVYHKYKLTCTEKKKQQTNKPLTHLTGISSDHFQPDFFFFFLDNFFALLFPNLSLLSPSFFLFFLFFSHLFRQNWQSYWSRAKDKFMGKLFLFISSAHFSLFFFLLM